MIVIGEATVLGDAAGLGCGSELGVY